MISYLVFIIIVELIIIYYGIKYLIQFIREQLRDNEYRILHLERRIEKVRRETKK